MANVWLALWLVCTAPDVCTSKEHDHVFADHHSCMIHAAKEVKRIWESTKPYEIRFTCISISVK